MAPENANVFLIEDDEVAAMLETEYLEGMGHHIVEEATSLSEAKQKIPELAKKGVQVAVVDGNLSFGDQSGKDGETLAKAIHKETPGVIVIGHTKGDPIVNADINVSKKAGLIPLGEAVTKV